MAVVEHFGQGELSVKPHCTYYRLGADGTYLRSWYYLMPELERFFKPKCYTWRGNRRLKLDKEFQPLDEIFVWHKAAITNRYSVGDSGFSHMYLADDMSEAIITDNRRHLLYQKPLKGFTYQQMRETFQNSFIGVHQDTY